MTNYVADFETTTREEDCRVWAYAICEVGNIDNIVIGTTIDEFMSWCRKQKSNVNVYFHNLKFDSQFIFPWLFKNGFKHADKPEDRATGTFSTLISDMGLYYSIEIIFYLKGKNVKKVTLLDSLKLIPLSVDAIAKALQLPYQKGSIDYKAHDFLPEGSPITEEEEEYLRHDVQIVASAIEYFHSQGLKKMTIGSCALAEYKKTTSKRYFDMWYPVQDATHHNDVKQSYRGGFTCLNPKFAGKIIGRGVVLDVNSLYPSVMYQELLPYGTPIFYRGKYKQDDLFPLYTQMIRCSFEIKKGKIPTIQIKHSLQFRGNEYLTDSGDMEVVLCLNSIDLEIFLDHYHVYNLEYLSGWKFKGTHGLFKEYIEKWSANKIKAKEEGNHGLYLISKLFLNSLYGKFGTDIRAVSKIPYLGEDGEVHFRLGEEEEKNGIYIAMASFITSYARRKTITASQHIQDNFHNGISKAQWVYSDTDSLHVYLNGEDKETFFANCGLEIHSTDLGAWDFETEFVQAKFLRQKCYIEQIPVSEEKYNKGKAGEQPELFSNDENGFYQLKVTVAGMPTACHKQVTFNNFKLGATFTGKKQPKIVANGVILKDVDFTIVK